MLGSRDGRYWGCAMKRMEVNRKMSALDRGRAASAALTRLMALIAFASAIGLLGIPVVPQQLFAADLGESTLDVPETLSRYSSDQLNLQNFWFVATSQGLNCRLEPSAGSPIVYGTLPLFTSLVAYDLVGKRGVPSEGLYWLRVLPRGPALPKPCYVAADSRYIQPEYPDSTWLGSLGDIGDDFTCSENIPGSINRVRLVTRSHLIYLCSEVGPTVPVGLVHGYVSFRRDGRRSVPDLVLGNPVFDPTAGGQYIFRNGRYAYLIDQPSFRYPASFLSVIYPNGSGYDELILEWLD